MIYRLIIAYRFYFIVEDNVKCYGIVKNWYGVISNLLIICTPKEIFLLQCNVKEGA